MKGCDKPRRQKRRPKEFRELPEPREKPAPKVVAVLDPADDPNVDEALMYAMHGPNWRQKP